MHASAGARTVVSIASLAAVRDLLWACVASANVCYGIQL
jgi:hypothetical protein